MMTTFRKAGAGWLRVGLALGAVAVGGVSAPAEGSPQPVLTVQATTLSLGGTGWRLGAFPFKEGERQQAQLPGFDDQAFRTVTVPGEVQRQVGLAGMNLYQQRREPTLLNDQEWWYRKRFAAPADWSGRSIRLVFEGVDYFCSVWLNGEKLGEHEGGSVAFDFDVTTRLKVGGDNLLAVKVTCPWLPAGRGFLEYMKGNLAMAVPGQVTEFPSAPFVLGPTWDGLPAGGNAVFPFGLIRDVKLVASGLAAVSDLAVATKSIQADGSATLVISGSIRNGGGGALEVAMNLRIDPDNFPGDPLSLPGRRFKLNPGENRFEQEVTVPRARLWWTWDTGEQNLYRATAAIHVAGSPGSDSRETVFGIRTIEVHADMSYWLNGRRVFLKGAWYPFSDCFTAKPTRAELAWDLELFRAANLNHFVGFTVVEQPDFYDLCDRLGILNFFEFPFIQFGPMAVMDRANPRREAYVTQALAQVRQIIIQLRNHPSIVVWAPFAEAQIKGKGWGAAGRDFERYGYQEFSDAIGRMVRELAPGTVFHPSFCDAGEQHFWMGTAGPWRTTPYQEQFQADTGFVSEYGCIALPDLRSLEKMLPSTQLWSEEIPRETRWDGLPIDVAAYSYQTSFDYVGLAGVLDRVRRFVDTDIKSAQELVDDSQLYQGFLFQYATEIYRRRKYHAINGTRIWAYLEPTPGIRFGFVDYFRVPKLGYYYLKRAQSRFAVSFAQEDALESQVAGRTQVVPVWLLNDHSRDVSYTLHCEITDLQGRTVWTDDRAGKVAADSASPAGQVEWLPAAEGVYLLRARAREKDGPLEAESRTYIKVTPGILSRPCRMLLIGQEIYTRPLALMAESLGVSVKVVNESSIAELALLRDPAALRRDYDLVWLASFDSLWKLLDAPAAEGLKAAVRDGLNFVHSGGPGSFHGGSIRAALLNLTPLAGMLPVQMQDRDDLWLGQPPPAAFDTLMNHAPIRGLRAAPGGGGRWALPEMESAELPGINRVTAGPGSKVELTALGWPLVVTGTFGKARTVAYTGFTPSWTERRSPWDRKMVSPHFLDQELASDPAVRTCFSLMARILAAAMGEPLRVDPDTLLAARTRPLFETLQDLPEASLELPAMVPWAESPDGATAQLTLRNRERFARLVRVRMAWGDAGERTPGLARYDDNYFDMLPGEEKTIRVDLRLPAGVRNGLVGRLVVEGSNLIPATIPVRLDFP